MTPHWQPIRALHNCNISQSEVTHNILQLTAHSQQPTMEAYLIVFITVSLILSGALFWTRVFQNLLFLACCSWLAEQVHVCLKELGNVPLKADLAALFGAAWRGASPN